MHSHLRGVNALSKTKELIDKGSCITLDLKQSTLILANCWGLFNQNKIGEYTMKLKY